MRAIIGEEEHITLARFLSNSEIKDRDLNDFVEICIKLEEQLLRKSSSKKDQAHSSSYSKKDCKEEEYKEEFPKNLPEESDKGKGEAFAHTHTSEIKCFKCLGRGHIASQCPTKRTIILRGINHYSSQDDVYI